MTISSTTKARIGSVLGVVIAVLTVAANYFNVGTVPTLTALGAISGAVSFAWGVFHAANSAPAK